MKDKKKRFDKMKGPGAEDLQKEQKKHDSALPPNPSGKIGNIVMASGLGFLILGYFTLYKGSDTAAPILIVLGIVTFGISLLLEPDWLPR